MFGLRFFHWQTIVVRILYLKEPLGDGVDESRTSIPKCGVEVSSVVSHWLYSGLYAVSVMDWYTWSRVDGVNMRLWYGSNHCMRSQRP